MLVSKQLVGACTFQMGVCPALAGKGWAQAQLIGYIVTLVYAAE